MTKPARYPISHSLTSFNGVEPLQGQKRSSVSGGAKVHHLPASLWKKKEGEAKDALDLAVERTRDFLFGEQLPEGYWWAELESNVTITAEYIMLFRFMGLVEEKRERKLANYILSKQKIGRAHV